MDILKIVLAAIGLCILVPMLVLLVAAIGWSGMGTAVLCIALLASIWNK